MSVRFSRSCTLLALLLLQFLLLLEFLLALSLHTKDVGVDVEVTFFNGLEVSLALDRAEVEKRRIVY